MKKRKRKQEKNSTFIRYRLYSDRYIHKYILHSLVYRTPPPPNYFSFLSLFFIIVSLTGYALNSLYMFVKSSTCKSFSTAQLNNNLSSNIINIRKLLPDHAYPLDVTSRTVCMAGRSTGISYRGCPVVREFMSRRAVRTVDVYKNHR